MNKTQKDFGSLLVPRRYTQYLWAAAIDREEKTLKTHEKKFLEENENRLVNISIQKRSVKRLRFKDVSSRFQVLYKKTILINFTGKQLYRSLFFDKALGLNF